MFGEVLALAGERKRSVRFYLLLMGVRGVITIAPLVILFHLVLAIMDDALLADALIQATITLFLVYFVINLMDYLLYLKSIQTGYGIAYDVRIRMEEKLNRLPLHCFTKKNVGNQALILGGYTSRFETGVYMLNLIAQYAVAAVAICLYFFILDWRLAFASLLSIPLIYLSYRWVKRIVERIHAEQEKAHQGFTTAIIELIQGMPVVRIFNQQNSLFDRFSSQARKYRDWNQKMVTDTTGPSLVFILFLSLDIVIILPIGFYLTSIGQADLRILVFFIIAVPFLTDSLYHSIFPYIEFRFAIEEGYRQIQDTLSEPEFQVAQPEHVPDRYDIVFSHVSFSYGEGEVLSDISFTIPEGTITALVGSSGAGKTTITNLLARFWDVSSGEIRIGGVNTTHIPMDLLLGYLAIVFQDVVLFNDTVIENIRLGNPFASDEEVAEAARAAQCESFIHELPDGYHTRLGERGARLSEGQKQRISIARAILKNAPILVLDEATVYVDPNNEYEMQEAISRLIRGKTVLVIAHRMSVIAGADQILVLKDGRLVESGDHNSLMDLSGIYRSFWDAQSEARHWHL